MSVVPDRNVRSRFVVSSRHPDSPQKVLAGKSAGQYTCNKKKCPMFAGYNICSHILAVAIHNGDSEALLKRCNHSANEPNIHNVAMIGMPDNADKKPTTRKRQPQKRHNQDENFAPSSGGSMCRKKPSLETKNLSPCNSKDRPLSLPAHQPQPLLERATSVSNPWSNMESDRQPSTSVSNPSHPPLLLQVTHLHPLSPSLPPSLIPATSLMSRVLPLTQIQITQQPTSCSQTSMTVTQPSCSYSLPSITQPSQTTDFQQPVSPTTSHVSFSKPFFVKFLTRHIKICQGCRSGYQRDHNGNSLPPLI